MKFKEATDALFEGAAHADLAKALGISVASIRQARLNPSAKAHRSPPRDWRQCVISIAEEKIWKYRRLIEALRNDNDEE